MGLAATLEQRVAAHVKAAKFRGLDDDAALAYAYQKEGLEPPRPERSLEDDVEDLHWKLACAERRADACSARARKLLVENRDLRRRLEARDRFAAGPPVSPADA